MVDNSTKRMQSYTEFLKTKAAEFRNREKLWHAINNYINANGGWCTSSPGDFKIMRVEVPPNSEIPIRLAERGFRLNYTGSRARGTPAPALFRLRLQSSSASRLTAGAFGFLTFTECGERPER
jgi:hypothetical protein